MKIKARDLKLADIVQVCDDEAFSTAVVKQIKDGIIHLFRPYAHTSDFYWTGGVLCYVGIEEFQICSSDIEMEVYERKELK